MDIEWNLADAKNRFSEVINLALTKGPQFVHRRQDKVVIISAKEYEKLKGKHSSFKNFLLNGPSLAGLDLSRDTSPSRDVSL